ncbi:putative nucleoredoxin 1 [Tetrabaena socialis]|uniref:Putative nucleoredoxin 1 n=1 Tax=Tetrabaena socialis TaxID=47790 RepID=A0A2J7ZUD7_9CHLO|nr:putative nucleoredoxin 1 [Tetrabaena socialis]|eukprot:PNH03850.1 putative nucleoredoxin 1 [Tetrabaena socialis]
MWSKIKGALGLAGGEREGGERGGPAGAGPGRRGLLPTLGAHREPHPHHPHPRRHAHSHLERHECSLAEMKEFERDLRVLEKQLRAYQDETQRGALSQQIFLEEEQADIAAKEAKARQLYDTLRVGPAVPAPPVDPGWVGERLALADVRQREERINELVERKLAEEESSLTPWYVRQPRSRHTSRPPSRIASPDPSRATAPRPGAVTGDRSRSPGAAPYSAASTPRPPSAAQRSRRTSAAGGGGGGPSPGPGPGGGVAPESSRSKYVFGSSGAKSMWGPVRSTKPQTTPPIGASLLDRTGLDWLQAGTGRGGGAGGRTPLTAPAQQRPRTPTRGASAGGGGGGGGARGGGGRGSPDPLGLQGPHAGPGTGGSTPSRQRAPTPTRSGAGSARGAGGRGGRSEAGDGRTPAPPPGGAGRGGRPRAPAPVRTSGGGGAGGRHGRGTGGSEGWASAGGGQTPPRPLSGLDESGASAGESGPAGSSRARSPYQARGGAGGSPRVSPRRKIVRAGADFTPAPFGAARRGLMDGDSTSASPSPERSRQRLQEPGDGSEKPADTLRQLMKPHPAAIQWRVTPLSWGAAAEGVGVGAAAWGLLGRSLVGPNGSRVDVSKITGPGKVVGLYFSAGKSTEFTPRLASMYKRFKEKHARRADWEVVYISSDGDRDAWKEGYAKMPWAALPYTNGDAQAALAKLYAVDLKPIAQGLVPSTLVLLDGETGELITNDGRGVISRDKQGDDFPWRAKKAEASTEPPVFRLLGASLLGPKGTKLAVASIRGPGKVIAFYFAAPEAPEFTPKLKLHSIYKHFKKKHPRKADWEVVFISSDTSVDAFNEYVKEMRWAALPYGNRVAQTELANLYNVTASPTLVLVDGDTGELISDDGRAVLSADTECAGFPWRPKPQAGPLAALSPRSPRTTGAAAGFRVLELLGASLLGQDGSEVAVASISGPGKVIGLYFSAHWSEPCRKFTPELAAIYSRFKQRHARKADWEVVFVSSDTSEDLWHEYLQEMPWLALPYGDRDAQAELAELCQVPGVPTLVLLDGETGELITQDGRSVVSNDSKAASMAPAATGALLPGCSTTLRRVWRVRKDGSSVAVASIRGPRKVIGLYFSAHWCGPCRQFTPELAAIYSRFKQRHARKADWEVVFVSSDRNEDSWHEYLQEMPWLALPYGEQGANAELSRLCQVGGIPTLVLLDGETGELITDDGCSVVGNDSECALFPWKPEAPAAGPSAAPSPRHRPAGPLPGELSTQDSTASGLGWGLPGASAEDSAALSAQSSRIAKQRSDLGSQLGAGGPPRRRGSGTAKPRVFELLGTALLGQGGAEVAVASIRGPGKVIGLYFSALWSEPCSMFTPELASRYREFKQDYRRAANWEVIFISADDDEQSFEAYYNEMPWTALPYRDRAAQLELAQLYKVSGIPTLVLIHSETGERITIDGDRVVVNDKHFRHFPWLPTKPVEAAVPAVFKLLGTSLKAQSGTKLVSKITGKGKVIGLYFAASWSAACRPFTTELASIYRRFKDKHKRKADWEVVFISKDHDELSCEEYFKEMPWLLLPYGNQDAQDELTHNYKVQGLPALVLVDGETGELITDRGRSKVTSDKECKDFPWKPKAQADPSVELLAQDSAAPGRVLGPPGNRLGQQAAGGGGRAGSRQPAEPWSPLGPEGSGMGSYAGGPGASGRLQPGIAAESSAWSGGGGTGPQWPSGPPSQLGQERPGRGSNFDGLDGPPARASEAGSAAAVSTGAGGGRGARQPPGRPPPLEQELSGVESGSGLPLRQGSATGSAAAGPGGGGSRRPSGLPPPLEQEPSGMGIAGTGTTPLRGSETGSATGLGGGSSAGGGASVHRPTTPPSPGGREAPGGSVPPSRHSSQTSMLQAPIGRSGSGASGYATPAPKSPLSRPSLSPQLSELQVAEAGQAQQPASELSGGDYPQDEPEGEPYADDFEDGQLPMTDAGDVEDF